ncbi:GNAT family N-acetyltransferase [Priestia taiwanensis]|uniref:N-acetyltransferase n=1 Tax=Priestia taiwanensis TaxID=1347902 RepID=A0A917AJY2_9BACI|nr:GNAT family protein [Priestia taiwanensis]MBM7361933.1 ribosomal-protein-alanine N-acetyltransferase [Priestia taiwanensis]GGE58119.1 N-acetyltransferase [Priestia taiwanensis]
MITQLQTKRLHVRRMNESDSYSLFNIWSDPDVTKFMNVDCFTDEHQAKEMITFLNELAKENKAYRFVIVEAESNEIIGSCGYNFLDFEHAKTEIGCDIAKAHWGKGYAPEIMDALLEYAFKQLNIHRIEAKVDPKNIKSIKLLQKLNFTFEGTLRDYEKLKGQFMNLHMYSKLATD